MKEEYHYLNLNPLTPLSTSKDERVSHSRELLVNCAGSINTSLNHKSGNSKGRLDYYLMYVLSGSNYVTANGNAVTVDVGDAIIIPPHTPYFQKFSSASELNYLWIHFTGSGVDNILKELSISLFPMVNKTSQNNHLQTRFQRLFDCFIKNDDFIERDLSASLEKLLIELARAIKNKQSPKISLSKSISYINSHYNASIKIPDLAKMELLSMTQYNLHFKRQMGMSPTKYIISKRISTAKDLIESSDLTIAQISMACGYEDYNFFAKVFKQVMGLSPRQYKSSLK